MEHIVLHTMAKLELSLGELTEALRLRKLIMCLLGSIQLYKIKGKQDDTRTTKSNTSTGSGV